MKQKVENFIPEMQMETRFLWSTQLLIICGEKLGEEIMKTLDDGERERERN